MNQRALIMATAITASSLLSLSPIMALLYGSLSYDVLGRPQFTLEKYVQSYSDALLFDVLLNTLAYALTSSLVATGLALVLAYINHRTNAPLKRIFHVIAIAPAMVPHILFSVAWIILLNPTNGIINTILKSRLNLEASPLNIYSLVGMSFVEGLLDLPIAYLVIAAAIVSFDNSLEESSRMCGANNLVTVFRITLPILKPAIAAAFILVTVRALSSFAVPSTIGMPNRIYVLATAIYRKTALGLRPDYGEAAALGMSLLVVSVTMVYAYRLMVSRSERFVTITGKGYRPSLINLGRWRYAASGLALLILALVVVFPVSVLVYTSLLPFYMVPDPNVLGLMTLDNWSYVLREPIALRALKNSMLLSILGGSVGVGLAFIIAYIVVKSRMPGRGVLESISFLPFSFPGIIVGLGFVWALIGTPLYGTIWALLFGYLATYLPYGLRPLTSAMLQVHNELEESSRIFGASFLQTLRKILFPLLSPALISGWALMATMFLRELSVSVVLSRPGSEVAAVYILRLVDDGRWGHLSALGLILIGISTALVVLVQRLGPQWTYE